MGDINSERIEPASRVIEPQGSEPQGRERQGSEPRSRPDSGSRRRKTADAEELEIAQNLERPAHQVDRLA